MNDPLFVPDKLQLHPLPSIPGLLECDYHQCSGLQRETWLNSCEFPVFDSCLFEFLEICHHFHFEVNLTAILSRNFEFNMFFSLLIPQVLNWRFCLLVRHDDGGVPCCLCIAVAWLGRTLPASCIFKFLLVM